MIPRRDSVVGSRRWPRVLVCGADDKTRQALEEILSSGCTLTLCGIDTTFDALASGWFDGLILDLDHVGLAAGRLLGEARNRGLRLPARIIFLDGSLNSVAPPSTGEALLLKKPLDGSALQKALFCPSDSSEQPLRRFALGAVAAGLAAGIS